MKIESHHIKTARSIMAAALKDPDLKWAYQSNIAMFLHDNYGVTDFKKRNQAARDILELIFGDE